MRKSTYTGMRCKRHPCDQTTVGVCASCLRERLLAVLVAQAKEAESGDDRWKSDPPPPLIFPRSVSPYVCRRSVHDDTWRHHCHPNLFYHTPQVGPTLNTKKKKKLGRLSLFSSLFGSSSRSEEIERDPTVSRAPNATSPSNSTPSWFSTLLPRNRKEKSRLFTLDDDISGGGCRRSCPVIDRGMSPSTEPKGRRGGGEGDDSPTTSGYSSESSIGWRKSAAPAPRRRGPPQHNRNVSGFGFCLSPLVRASPNSHQNRHETVTSVEFRGANRHHLSTTASLCANRSRKLADFGRYP